MHRQRDRHDHLKRLLLVRKSCDADYAMQFCSASGCWKRISINPGMTLRIRLTAVRTVSLMRLVADSHRDQETAQLQSSVSREHARNASSCVQMRRQWCEDGPNGSNYYVKCGLCIADVHPTKSMTTAVTSCTFCRAVAMSCSGGGQTSCFQGPVGVSLLR